MKERLSSGEARKVVLLAQGLPPAVGKGRAAEATLGAIERLGYVQIDTISVIERAHHHTLWNRNPRYEAGQLDRLVEAKQVFEYWSHAAAYLPFRDFRFSLVRKRALAGGAESHWYERDPRMMKLVRDRIEAEGPLMARDFEHTGKRVGEWQPKPAKRALETLFMQGDLMAPRREKFQKVYDLTERVVPAGVDTTVPTPEEYARYLITGFLRAQGLGQAEEMAYLLKGTKPLVAATLREMVAAGEVVEVQAGGRGYVALPGSLEQLGRPLRRGRAKILSPFDNLVIQRKRLQALFGFDYLIECYVPAAKRRYGYFVLPVLWDGRLVARMDCKAERRSRVLHVQHLAVEPGLSAAKQEGFFAALRREMEGFLRFNGCEEVRVHRTTPGGLQGHLLE